MKFNVSSSALLSALHSISKVIASKNTLPILDSFLFDLKGEKLMITASDTETRLVTSVDVVSSDGSGLFAVDAKRLLDPLKELPEQPLTFDINDENMTINVDYENGKFNLPGQKGDTYPQQKPLKEDAIILTLESQILLNGINRSLFATADDELRPVMNGVYFDIQTGNLTFVASDGHKLVRLRNLSIQSKERASFILPKKPANLLKSLLAKDANVVTVVFDDNNAYVKMPAFEMVCRLIEGRYPNYDAVIPSGNPNLATIDRLSFLMALKRVSVFSQASGLIKVQLSENKMVVSAQDIDFSTSAEETIVCQYTATPLNIGFKASNLIDILTNISSENVVLQLADPSRAGIIVPTENEENEDLLMLLMPMMLND
ncbi:MAG: DNA polymerase III subunit beta [Dysgonamonadaceae bacterium]|jgi:DNA polymerase-3 subunit beta|nr:DNA polymerase III subunit beta [Dysgonamonadaceae bacterium]